MCRLKLVFIVVIFITSAFLQVYAQDSSNILIRTRDYDRFQELKEGPPLQEGYGWVLISAKDLALIFDMDISEIPNIKVAAPLELTNSSVLADDIYINEIKIPKGTRILKENIEIAPPRECYKDYYKFIEIQEGVFIPKDIELYPIKINYGYNEFAGSSRARDDKIVVNVNDIHCGGEFIEPWIKVDDFVCALDSKDFPFMCAEIDEISLIKQYSIYSANYLDREYWNPRNKDILSETLGYKTSGDGTVPLYFSTALEDIDKYAGKEAAHSLFNTSNLQALKSAFISVMSMYEHFSGNINLATRRNDLKALFCSGKNLDKCKGPALKVLEESIDSYITQVGNDVPSFFDHKDIETESKNFNDVIDEINDYCRSQWKINQDFDRQQASLLIGAELDVGGDDVGRQKDLDKEVKRVNDDQRKITELYLLKLIAQKYSNLMFSREFSSHVGMFDIERCIFGDGILKSPLKLKKIPEDHLARFKLLKIAITELFNLGKEGVESLLEDRRTILDANDSGDYEKILLKYLKGNPAAFNQFRMPYPSSREFLLTTKLIGKHLSKDAFDAAKDYVVTGTAVLAGIAGGTLLFTVVGTPFGAALLYVSQSLFVISSTAIVTNSIYNYKVAEIDAELYRTGGITNNKEQSDAYSEMVETLDRMDDAVFDGMVEAAIISPLAVAVIYKNIYKFSKAMKVLGINVNKKNITALNYGRGWKRYKNGLKGTKIDKVIGSNNEQRVLLESILGKLSKSEADRVIKTISKFDDIAVDNFLSKMEDVNWYLKSDGTVDLKKLLRNNPYDAGFSPQAVAPIAQETKIINLEINDDIIKITNQLKNNTKLENKLLQIKLGKKEIDSIILRLANKISDLGIQSKKTNKGAQYLIKELHDLPIRTKKALKNAITPKQYRHILESHAQRVIDDMRPMDFFPEINTPLKRSVWKAKKKVVRVLNAIDEELGEMTKDLRVCHKDRKHFSMKNGGSTYFSDNLIETRRGDFVIFNWKKKVMESVREVEVVIDKSIIFKRDSGVLDIMRNNAPNRKFNFFEKFPETTKCDHAKISRLWLGTIKPTFKSYGKGGAAFDALYSCEEVVNKTLRLDEFHALVALIKNRYIKLNEIPIKAVPQYLKTKYRGKVGYIKKG